MALPLQIKQDHRLPVQGVPAPFTLGAPGAVTSLAIDGRRIPIASCAGAPVEDVARSIARVPAGLRAVLAEVVISPTANPADATWAEVYGLPVRSGMGAVASGSGTVVIYPHGLERLHTAGGDVFVRNLMHELGHCWSLRDWARDPAAKDAWLDAIARDGTAPSTYAALSFRKSGLPHEDVAEATALYFLVLGTPGLDAHRAAMPARFALLAARFGG
jgi:hypothetical protein